MPDYTLYSFFRSSCSARLRIVLNLKQIPYKVHTVNLMKKEQLSDDYKLQNPSLTVPTLVIQNGPDISFTITQSVAALEYLEEVHPEIPILPALPETESRAIVRALSGIISADIQPPTSLRVMGRIMELGGSAEEWSRTLMAEGLRAYEKIAQQYAGNFSFGNDVTMADACLVPAIWNAQLYKVDLSEFPVVMRVFQNLSLHPAVIRAHWKNQADTPDELRS
ncbi:hypothetical protein NQ176_g961 [Zarea fungicola]|uniref:Uncharacterized protein n=1 Tax=Zarea fungicola TaxID=93591 RepID=A0ACC1NVU4_9HYPO|nr:hypothetical protein NQ176_g961 [Lecanicillium fungicola]